MSLFYCPINSSIPMFELMDESSEVERNNYKKHQPGNTK
jgi:hypothetical protein